MTGDLKGPADCSGEFIWCVKLHEDKLECVSPNTPRQKPNGAWERVNEYRLFGKDRPALVLAAVRGCRKLTVWYTCTSSNGNDGAIDVSKFTLPPENKRAFLKPHPDEIRRVPNSENWCGRLIYRLDPTAFDAFLKRAAKVPASRF